MTRVLAICTAADPTGSVKQFDLALPLLRDRFDVQRHTLPAEVSKLLATTKPDLIHSLGADAFRAMRKVTVANARPGARPLPLWLAAGASTVEPLLGFAPGLTATFSQSEQERDWAARLVPAPLQFSAIPAVRNMSPEQTDLVRETSQTPFILASGGFDTVANLKHVVWAFDVLKYAHPSLHLVLLGDGPQREVIERFAHSLGFDDLRVRCVGHQDEITPFLQRASQAWSSHTRGGTKFLLEAMSLRVPVIATRTTESESLLAAGPCGELVSADRPVEMAKAAHRVFTSSGTTRAMVVAAEAKASRYPVVGLANALAGVYDSLTSSVPPRHE